MLLDYLMVEMITGFLWIRYHPGQLFITALKILKKLLKSLKEIIKEVDLVQARNQFSFLQILKQLLVNRFLNNYNPVNKQN
jgi:hypothetical protein